VAEITTVTYTPDEIRIFGEDNDYKTLTCTVDVSQGALSCGTPMAMVTATQKYVALNTAASDGSQNFAGFLANTINPAAETRDVPAILWMTGYFDLAKVTALGWNSTALSTTPGARVIAGRNILVIPG